MNARRGRWLQLQKAMWLLVVVATVSMVITLHLSNSLIWFRPGSEAKSNEILHSSLDKQEPEHLTVPESIINAKVSHVTQGQHDTGSSYLQAKYKSSQSQNGDMSGEEGYNLSDLVTPGLNQRINATMLRTNSQSAMNDALSIRLSDSKDSRGFKTKENEFGSLSTFKHEFHSFLLPVMEPNSRKSQEDHFAEASLDTSELSTLENLYNKIWQVEKVSLFVGSVVVVGSLSSIKQHLPLIEAAFRKYKTKVTYKVEDVTPEKSTQETGESNWSILMCLNTTHKKDNCVISSQHPVHHKASTIPELTSVMTSPRLLCHTAGDRLPGQWYGGKLPCYTPDMASVTKGNCDGISGWWVIWKDNNDTPRQHIPCGRELFTFGNLNYRKNESIIVSLPNNLLTIDGRHPLVWQAEVLVTSLLPPRVYLHPAGLGWGSLQDFVNRKHQKNVSLLELHQLITELTNESAADVTLARLQSSIMEVVRFLEKQISARRDYQRICQKCFQLLAVVLVFDSSFQPIILEVVPSPYSEHLTSLSDYLLEQNVLEDLAAMLVSSEAMSVDSVRALSYMGVTHLRDEKICSDDKSICFGEDEITYLLDTRREQRAARNWIRLFPSTAITCTNIHSTTPTTTLEAVYASSLKPVNSFEKFVVSVEEYFLCPLAKTDKVEKLTSNLGFPVHAELDERGDPVTGKLSNISKLLVQTCHTDNSSLLYLSAIHTYPYIQLFPEFSPLSTEYQAYIDYHTTLIQIWGVTKHCGTQAKLDNKYSSSRSSNFSLGLGDNTAHILVVGLDHGEPYILNIYKVTIHRSRDGQDLGQFDTLKGQYNVCSLKQDCSLPLSLNSSCGLQPVSQVLDWKEYMSYHRALPPCDDGSVTGEWMVPCFDCHKESSCHWQEAVWQPSGCQERQLSSDELKSCFADKKVLFLGDSTNRGILHYIIERLNGSLQQWDKTHNTCTYPDLNDNQTMFGFAYYPQFWLMPRERPVFSETLHHLLNKTADGSGKQTVIVLGGVHWLGKHHLDMLVDRLQREGLNKSRVIVKGLGAGFHQPVSGVHQLSLEDQQRLSTHNHAVLSHARQLGFSTVDTFSMTMVRYKDFLQGKCACHFHQVSAVQLSVIKKLSWEPSVPVDYSVKYHVEGDINSVYSEMVINRICASNGG